MKLSRGLGVFLAFISFKMQLPFRAVIFNEV